MKQVKIEELNENFIRLIHQDWAVLTVQTGDKVNGMTVNWVQVGWLWNKPVATVYVRPQRFTFPFICEQSTFSLAFFEESERKNIAYLGKTSGKDEDKLAHCGYTTSLLNNTPVINQAKMIFTLKKLYVSDLKENFFTDQDVLNSAYPKRDFHREFVAEITEVWIQD